MDIRLEFTGHLVLSDVKRLACKTGDSGASAFTSALFRLLTDEDKRVADNAAWVLSHAKRPGRVYLQDRQQELIDIAMVTSDETLRRILLAILQKQRFDAENIRTDFLDFCLSAITDGRQPVAVRALCVYLGYVLCRPFAELQGELVMTLDVLDGEELKPGLRHACRTVRSKIPNVYRMDYQAIIDKYYPEENALRKIFLAHSKAVTGRALKVCDVHPELHLDRRFVEEAAMLHDIGIYLCDAPGIQCFGRAHYLQHGRLGAGILRAEGYPRHARVCERHTGTGLTKEAIVAGGLPLPHEDFMPETLEEKVVCYADKFFSKSTPEREKTTAQVERSLAPFGADGLARFREWEEMFG